MNVLLTGGAGFIGSHTAAVLMDAGHRIIVLDNLCNSSASVVDDLKTLGRCDVPFVRADVRNQAAVAQCLRDHQVDSVVHFAGLKAVGESVAKPLEYYENNIGGTLSLLRAMGQTSVKRLVFSSSATVYGDPKYLPLDEAHPVSATNPYGRSKLQIEEILEDFSRANADWRITSLRYFNPVGAHPSGLLGENPNGIPNNLMPFVARVAVGKLPQLSVFGNDYDTPDGTGVRDYIHVMDLAEGHLAALAALAQRQTAYDVINLGTGSGYSVLDLVKAFERASGRSVPYQIVARRPGDIASCYANVDKASRVLQWQAKRSLDDMCATAWHYQSRQSQTSPAV